MNAFFSLTPDSIINCVEAAVSPAKMGVRATGFALALNSVENRVVEVGFEDESSVIAKFYRPNRWSSAQILEEHAFIQRLHQAEVPVIPPLPLEESTFSKLADPAHPTLAQSPDGIAFAIFPKVKGRLRDELEDSEIRQIGRYLGRLHSVGASMGDSKRIRLDVNTYGRNALRTILDSPLIGEPNRSRYQGVVEALCRQIEPLLSRTVMHRIHGDCHLGNILWNQGTSFFLDFDDMVIGPPVQDFWMVIRGRDDEAKKQREQLIEGYELFKEFDRSTLSLIEPLRGLRMIHYAAWVVERWDDPSFPKMFPQFGSSKYWQEEIEALQEIDELIAQPSRIN